MCVANSKQKLVGIYNLQQSTAPKSWSKYTTFDEVEVNSEKLNPYIIAYNHSWMITI